MVKVRNAQGGLIALLYGGDAFEDRLVVPPLSGRYEVEVLSEDPQQQGTVNLLVTCSDAAPGCIDGGADTAACPPCIDETFGGELCADFAVTATDEGGGAFSFAWPAVEGAEWYIFVILDAWGTLVADSPVLLEGDTSHAYTFNPADLDRGPFTVGVRAGRGRDVAELLCVGLTTFAFEGVPAEACSGIGVNVAVVPGEERRVVASWTAAPGAAAYTIHVYAYGDDGGLIGIRVLTVPGEHITYHLEGVFPADYSRFQISVRAYSEATGGGAFGDMPQGYLCGGETDVEFPKPGPVEWGPRRGRDCGRRRQCDTY
ncbi:MAG: hypothetical protein M5R40_17310 [Anaerolineae bacterium]|nr:hypothetical protein [Anaerolineae bacterium]